MNTFSGPCLYATYDLSLSYPLQWSLFYPEEPLFASSGFFQETILHLLQNLLHLYSHFNTAYYIFWRMEVQALIPWGDPFEKYLLFEKILLFQPFT